VCHSVLQWVVVCCGVTPRYVSWCGTDASQCTTGCHGCVAVYDAVRCNVSYFVAGCCSVLRCVTAQCGVLQGVVVLYSVLQYVVVCCGVLQCVSVCCGVLQRVPDAVICVAVGCRAL